MRDVAPDTFFLVQVLRTAKFSQLRARELIENILTMRTKCPEYMVNIDTHEPGLLTYIDKGCVTAYIQSTLCDFNPSQKWESFLFDVLQTMSFHYFELKKQPINGFTTVFAVLHLVTLTSKDGSLHGRGHLVQSRGN